MPQSLALFVPLFTLATAALFGVVLGLLAVRKGYSFGAWFGTGALVLVAAFVLAFLPPIRGRDLPEEYRRRTLRLGNLLGVWMSVGVLAVAAIQFFLAIYRQASAERVPDLQTFYDEVINPAHMAISLLCIVTLIASLVALVVRGRTNTPFLAVLGLTLLVLSPAAGTLQWVLRDASERFDEKAQLWWAVQNVVLRFLELVGLLAVLITLVRTTAARASAARQHEGDRRSGDSPLRLAAQRESAAPPPGESR